jgi:hypothetical protein
MTWVDLALAVGTIIAVTAVLGGGVAWSVGLRGLWASAAAPAFTLTIVAGSAIVAPWLGLRWSILPPVLVAGVIAGGAWAVRAISARVSGTSRVIAAAARPSRDYWAAAAVALGALLIGARFVQAVGDPDAFSQTFDNVFHLNAVRYVLDSGSASSLSIGTMTSPGGGLPFYPAAWHAMVSLVVQVSGVTIPVATNAMALVASALYWPITAILLTRTMFGRSPIIVVATGALAASLPAFPVLLYDYGVLYPLLLGLSVLPFSLAVVLVLGRIASVPTPRGTGWWLFILAGALCGMTLAHPGALVAFLALSAPVAAAVFLRFLRATRGLPRLATVAAGVGYLAMGALLVFVLRPPAEARGWPISMSLSDALATVATGSMWYQVPAIVAALSVALGLVWAVVVHSRAALIAAGMYLIGAWLFVVVAALPLSSVRDAFTGSWYNNLPRLAAILAIAMIPVGAFGAARTVAWLARLPWVASTMRRAPWTLRTLTVGLAAVAVIGASQAGAPARAAEWASVAYRTTSPAPLLDADELALINRIGDHVPPGETVAGDPFTGAALVYAFGDRPALMPHTLTEITPEIDTINEALVAGTFDSSACAALDEEGVRFVLDFGTTGVHGPRDGLPLLESSGDVLLVDQQGAARLYEITAC